MICLNIRLWSLNDNWGRGGTEDVARGNGAGATNFWNGATYQQGFSFAWLVRLAGHREVMT